MKKSIFQYVASKETFTQLELKDDLMINDEKYGARVSNFLNELVYWEYLIAEKQSSTVRYYRF